MLLECTNAKKKLLTDMLLRSESIPLISFTFRYTSSVLYSFSLLQEIAPSKQFSDLRVKEMLNNYSYLVMYSSSRKVQE